MKRRELAIFLLVVIGIWLFFRDPIWFGERNADKMEKEWQKETEQVLDKLDEAGFDKEDLKEKIRSDYSGHLILLEHDGEYYGMINVSGTLMKMDIPSLEGTEIFSVKARVGEPVIKDNSLYFISGKIETREDRGLGMFFHSSTIRVMKDISKWKYDFETQELEEITKG